MLKRFISILSLVAVSTLALATHGGSVLAYEPSAHAGNHHQSISSNCQTLCSSSLSRADDDDIIDVAIDEKEPHFYPNPLSRSGTAPVADVAIKTYEVWRSSSWVPPDKVLLAGLHSTSR